MVDENTIEFGNRGPVGMNIKKCLVPIMVFFTMPTQIIAKIEILLDFSTKVSGIEYNGILIALCALLWCIWKTRTKRKEKVSFYSKNAKEMILSTEISDKVREG
jgi:hypothetical protein